MAKGMSGRIGQKWITRFMRSRGLTLSVAFALFLGWIVLAGFLLWQVKVKEEFPCLASLSFPSGPEGFGGADSLQIRVKVFRGPDPNLLASIQPGDEIDLAVAGQGAQKIGLRTVMVGLESEKGLPALLLRPAKPGESALELYRTAHGEPMRLSMGLRSKRLLQVAFERSPLPK